MAVVKVANNAVSTLASGITDSATTIALQSGDEGAFPSPSGGDWFPVTVVDGSGNLEIMKCTARSGVNLTVTRAQEGTTAYAFSAGAAVELRATAAALEDLAENLEHLGLSANVTTLLGAADFAAFRTSLSLVVGTDVQAYHANLAALAGLTGAADKLAYFTGSGAMSLADLSAFARTILDDADAAAVRATISAAIDTLTQGQHTINLLASGMVSRTTNGASFYNTEKATNDVMVTGYEFDSSTPQAIQIAFPLPKSWNAGTIVPKFYWTPGDTAGTGAVVWGIRARAASDDDAIDGSWGTAVEVTDTFLADGDQHQSAEGSAMTIGGTPAAEEMIYFEIYRDPTDGSDTYTQNAVLQAVMLHYTTDDDTDD